VTVAPSSASLDALLAPFLAAPERAGVLTDFDGTLSPIVDEPEAARPLPEAVDVLHRLAARYARVAVVSGRPAAFLARRLRLDADSRLVASGLYGMEYAQGDQVTTNPRAEEWRGVVHRVACEAEEQVPHEVHVERKGLSVTLHYRVCPEQAVWVRTWAEAAAARTGLLLHPARMSEELRPPVEVDKGTVVAELAEGLSAACFLGDDIGDLPAFAALDRLRAEQGIDTLKVVVASPEAPRVLIDQGDVVVGSPAEALGVLERLLS
jgi:trehalose 6-phosphate phosphatase